MLLSPKYYLKIVIRQMQQITNLYIYILIKTKLKLAQFELYSTIGTVSKIYL